MSQDWLPGDDDFADAPKVLNAPDHAERSRLREMRRQNEGEQAQQ